MKKKYISNPIKKLLAFNEACRDSWVARQAYKLAPGTKVLDVGAGSCPYRNCFSHCEYKSHDFAKLESGLLRGHEAYASVDYVSDICSLPVESGAFDAVVCTEVLEHVPEPIRALHEIGRVIRPGGKVILTAPLGSGLHQEPYHFYGGYTPYWYKKFLAESGFTDVTIESNRGFFSLYGQECLRFAIVMAPWRGPSRLPWLPLWLFGLPWCLLVPLLAKFLDGTLVAQHEFTVGYHVTATKSLP